MPKRKKITNHWHKKQIDKKIFFGSILASFLICVLVIVVYDSPLNSSHFSLSDFFQITYDNWMASHPLTLPQINLFPIPSSTPIPTHIPKPVPHNPGEFPHIFYIHSSSKSDPYISNGNFALKPHQQQGISEITLDASLNGRIAELPVGTLIYLNFPDGGDTITVPDYGILGLVQTSYSERQNGIIETLKVIKQGDEIITIQAPPSHTTFTSSRLGISFAYINQTDAGQNFFAREIGNSVYLYDDALSNPMASESDSKFLSSDWANGYSVRVFYKTPEQSLTEAIKQNLLIGYSESNCPVTILSRSPDPGEDPSYEFAQITLPPYKYNSWDDYDAARAKCPGRYVDSSGIRYFMMNPKVPNKFVFVNVGEDDIPSGIGSMWNGSIKIF